MAAHDGVDLNPRTALAVDAVPLLRPLYEDCTKPLSTPASMSDVGRQARPSPSTSVAENASGLVGSSANVKTGDATSSPIRLAKSDRPLRTASPFSVAESTDRNWAVT